MEHTNRITIQLKKEIEDLDNQILTLMNKKKQAQEDYNKTIPSALEVISNKKRNLAEKVQGDFECLKGLLAQDKLVSKGKENTEEIKEEIKEGEGIRKLVKSKRNVYSDKTKKMLLDFIEEYGYTTVEERTGISHDSLKTIKKNFKKNGGWKKRGRKIRYPDLDSDVRSWILERRLKGIKITTKRAMAYARKLAADRKYEGVAYGWGWMRGFLRRHNLSLRKPPSTNVKPFEMIRGKIEEFIEKVKELLATDLYDKDFIFNLDETSVPTEATKGKTVEQKGLKRVKVNSVGREKECHTVLLGATITGNKLPALIIIKGAGVKTIKIFPRNVRIRYREEGSWMDKDKMKNYVRTVLKYWAEDIPAGKRGLLLLDNFKGHIDKEIESQLKELRIDVKTLPPNTTACLQPLDLSVNAAFKQYYADEWDDYQSRLDSKGLTTKAQNYKAPSKEEKVLWIGNAWEKVAKKTIQNGWKCYLEDQVSEERSDVETDLESSQIPTKDIGTLKDAFDNETLEDAFDNGEEDLNDDLEHFYSNGVNENELLDYEVYPSCEKDETDSMHS